MDGEGTICIMYANTRKKHPTTNLSISVYQSDKRLMDWLVFHYGGKFYEHNMKNSSRPGYSWYAPTGKEAREKFILLLIPHLLLKKEQGMLALEYVRLSRAWTDRAKRLDLVRRCQLLNRFTARAEISKQKSDALEAHQKSSYAGPRRDIEEPVTTNMPNSSPTVN